MTCPVCSGAGAITKDSRFRAPFHYVFGGVAGAFQVPTGGKASFPKQLANDWEWEMIFIMGTANYPAGVALQLQDTGSQFNFSDQPVAFNDFVGNGQLPFPIGLLIDDGRGYRFGRKTSLNILAVDIGTIVQPNVVIGNGNGAAVTFTGTLAPTGSTGGPVLPGSVTVTDPPGVVVGTDAGKNGQITGGAGAITGTINYQTGAISVTYSAAPAAGTAITVAWTAGVTTNNVEIDLWGHALLEEPPAKSGRMQMAA